MTPTPEVLAELERGLRAGPFRYHHNHDPLCVEAVARWIAEREEGGAAWGKAVVEENTHLCQKLERKHDECESLRARVAELERENERLANIMRRAELPIDHAANALSWRQQCEGMQELALEQGRRAAEAEAKLNEAWSPVGNFDGTDPDKTLGQNFVAVATERDALAKECELLRDALSKIASYTGYEVARIANDALAALDALRATK